MNETKLRPSHTLRAALAALLCALAISLCTAGAAAESASVRLASSGEQSNAYWNTYGIPSSSFTAVANLGYFPQPAELAKAFDRNLGSAWKSNFVNKGEYTLDGVKHTNWHNIIDVSFTQSVTIDRVLYAAINDADGKGYAKTMRIWYDADSQGEFEQYKDFTSNNSTSLMCFSFGEPLTVARLRLEWMDIPTYHYWNATAAEIVFLQPEIPELEGMFSDFTRTSLSPGYDRAKIAQLRASLETNINYESQFKPLLDRAQGILDGSVSFDSRRLFSTDPATNGGNLLYQYGNRRSYTQGTLGISWFGIDKQSIGLSGKAGETITVYVDAPEGVPLPNIDFTQYWGSWRGWQGETSLKRGINVITVPSYCVGYCTYPVQQQGGGPFYIENPYTPAQQGGDIKIYIEGGYSFPVYRLGADENAFRAELAEYKAKFAAYGTGSPQYYFQDGVGFNVAEMESDHVLVTVQATNTYNGLYGSGRTALASMTNWDIVIEKLMEYDGIPATKSSKYASRWNDCNEHLGINVRLGQPVGAAYGAYEQVGVFTDDWIGGAVYCDGRLGWGMIHEVGHTMDMGARVVSECSNNMYSKYFESVEFSNGTRGEFGSDLANLTSDRIDHTASSYFNTNRYNYLVWFRLEAYHPGYWGELANLYRYDPGNCSGLNSTEKHIYLSSRVLGIDLRYYYERFGYAQSGNDTPFTIAGQSAALNSAMQALINSGAIRTDIAPKFWYYDSQQFRLNFTGQLNTAIGYTEADSVEIRSIEKTASGNSLLLSGGDGAKNHLGYEILEGSDEAGYDVIGFTYSGVWQDGASYPEGYTPCYKVRAVDRMLRCSGLSQPRQPDSDNAQICRIESTGTVYPSIAKALEAASAGDTLSLLADRIETGIIINKSITLRGDPSLEAPAVLSKGSSGILIKVTGGATVTIEGEKLILDGNSFDQSGSLIYCDNGTLTLNGLELRNNRISSGGDSYGGAIRVTKGTLNLNGCNIHHCVASYGGGVSLSAAGVTLNVKNGTQIHSNTAYSNGGGISLTGAAYLYGSSVYNNSASSGGGGVYVYNGGILCVNTDFNQYSPNTAAGSLVRIYGNSARDGGGLYQDGNTKLYNVLFENNSASANGGGIYSAATSGSHRSVYAYAGTVIQNNTAANTGSQVYSKCGSGAGPKLTDTIIAGSCTQGRALLHQESGTAGVFELTRCSLTMNHSSSLIKTDEIPAACETPGRAEYYTCPDCGAMLNPLGATLTEGELVIPALQHQYSEAWSADASGHFHSCTRPGCGSCTEHEPHVTGADAICTVCGYNTHVHSLTLIPAIEADCSHGGRLAYYSCTCGKLFADAEGSTEISDISALEVSALNHDYSTQLLPVDDRGHAHVCSRCKSHDELLEHSFGDTPETVNVCSVCGFVRPHVHELSHVEPESASCLQAGHQGYYVCSACCVWFSSDASNGVTDTLDEIEDHSSLIIPALGHDFSGSWLSDGAGHRHKCSRCTAEEAPGAHVTTGDSCLCLVCSREHSALTYVSAKSPTATEEGCIEHYRCSCGKLFADSEAQQELSEVSLPATGSGTVLVSSVSISASGSGVSVGCSLQLTAEVQPENADNKALSWSIVSGSQLGTVDGNGLFSATAQGDVTLRATACDGSGVYGEITISVLPAPAHIHSWAYTAQGATITAVCSGEGSCESRDNTTLTISYNAMEGVAELSAQGLAGLGSLPPVQYQGIAPTVYAQSETPPTAEGSYRASITVSFPLGEGEGSCCAYVDYSIVNELPQEPGENPGENPGGQPDAPSQPEQPVSFERLRAELSANSIAEGQQLTVSIYGNELMDSSLFSWSVSSGREYVTMVSPGVFEAKGGSGTVTLLARLIGDPLNRSVSVSFTTTEAPRGIALVLEGKPVTRIYSDLSDPARQTQFVITPSIPQGSDIYKFKVSSSDKSVAAVKDLKYGSFSIQLSGKSAGACIISFTPYAKVNGKDKALSPVELEVFVNDFAPKTESAVTINSFSTAPLYIPLAVCRDNPIVSEEIEVLDVSVKTQVTVSTALMAEYKDGFIELTALDSIAKPGKYRFVFITERGEYTADFTLKVKNSYPKLSLTQLTVPQAGKVGDSALFSCSAADGSKLSSVTYTGTGYDCALSGGQLVFTLNGQPLKAGKLLVSLEGYRGFTELKVTIKTAAPAKAPAAPTAKLASGSLSLNTLCPEIGDATALTLSGCSGELSAAFSCKQPGAENIKLSLAGGKITAALTGPVAQGGYKFTVSLSCGGTQLKPLSLTVKVSSSAPALSAKVSGKLDVTSPAGALCFTLSLKNLPAGCALSSPELVDAVSGAVINDFALSLGKDAAGNTTVTLKLKDGVSYGVNGKLNTYNALLRLQLTGTDISLSTGKLSIKLTQSALKLKADASSLTLYQSQAASRTLVFTLRATGPEGARISDVSIGSLDALFRRSLADAASNVAFTIAPDGRSVKVYVTVNNLSRLKAGKSYTLPLEVTPAGAVGPKATVKINLSLKVLR